MCCFSLATQLPLCQRFRRRFSRFVVQVTGVVDYVVAVQLFPHLFSPLLRPDNAALPVLPGNFRPAFFLNRATPTGGRIILTDCPWGIEQPLRFT
ncbi:hypothetical protein ECP03052938_5164 [Escherichia coli p0305293.8]|nr:hypothetical protein ECP03052939_4751 [Escherichia coli p0305293.9]ENG75321.1 hypothetical protein ECP03052938_5164 [Escherichia coli p0305293.8]